MLYYIISIILRIIKNVLINYRYILFIYYVFVECDFFRCIDIYLLYII